VLGRFILSLAVVGALLSACGGDDTNALQTQVAQLQTQVAQPTATLAATPTPGPDRVVGVTWTCERFSITKVGLVGPVQDSGNICELVFSPNNQGQLYASPTPGFRARPALVA
jgi:hypothetical protein